MSGEAEVTEEEIAVPAPTSDVTKSALQEKGKVQEISVNNMFELLLVDSAELWIHGLTDGVVSAKEALFPLVGKFLTGQPATALQKEGFPPCLFAGVCAPVCACLLVCVCVCVRDFGCSCACA